MRKQENNLSSKKDLLKGLVMCNMIKHAQTSFFSK